MLVARCVLLVTLLVSVFTLDYTESRSSKELSGGDMNQPSDCVNCTICQYPCHHQSHSSLPPGGYPLYGVPPPPPQQSGYPSYGAPPPPPPAQAGINCPQPQTPGMQTPCCNPPPGGPLTGPPSPYTYVPFNNYAAASPLENSLYFFVMLGLPFAVVF